MSSLIIAGDTSGQITIAAPAVAGSNTLTLPVITDTITTLNSTQTLANKTLTAPVLSGTATGTYTLGGTPTISSPTISAPVLSGTTTGTYTLGGIPTISSPVLSGTATGTYTLGGTPTISSPVLSGTATGTYTLGGTPSLAATALTGTIELGRLGSSGTANSSSYLRGDNSWAVVPPAPFVTVTEKTANYTLLTTDESVTIYANSSSMLTITLPASAGLSVGWAAQVIARTTAGVKLLCQGADVVVEGVSGAYYFAQGLARLLYVGGGTFQIFGAESSGTYRDFASSTVPTGWLTCDGTAISRTTYGALFNRISTTWGAGDGSTTFNLPDHRGRTEIGSGQGTGLTNRAIAGTGGAETHSLTSGQVPGLSVSAATTQTICVTYSGGSACGGYTTGVTLNGGISVNYSGSGSSHNIMQPFIVTLKCIKY